MPTTTASHSDNVICDRRENKPLIMSGLYPATVTPFAEDLSVDWTALERHLRETAAVDGVEGLVVNGGLAELLQLTADEQVEIVKLARRICAPGQLVVAGIEGRSAKTVVEQALRLKAAGAQALLVFPPFDVRAYRRLAADADSVYRFFAELDRDVDLPLIVFQYPPHSGSAYSMDALRKIVGLRNVVAIKAASGTTPTYVELWDAMHKHVSVLAAVDSPPLLDMLMHGSHGALIGISAIVPEIWVKLLRAAAAGDRQAASAVFEKACKPLMASVFENQQPKRLTNEAAATKEALVLLGQIPSSRVRPPAVDVDAAVTAEILQSLRDAELLKS